MTSLQEKVSKTREDLPVTLALVGIIFTIIFIWLGLTQIGLMMQGLEMMGVKWFVAKEKSAKVEKQD